MNYTPDWLHTPQLLTPNQDVTLQNNSNCGDTRKTSWMCTFRIVSTPGTYAQLHITNLNIAGPFAAMFSSAGVSVYNVLNDIAVLAGHWFHIDNIPADNLGAVSIRKTVLLGMAIPMLKIRRPTGRLIFNMGIPIPGKTVFLIETGPWSLQQRKTNWYYHCMHITHLPFFHVSLQRNPVHAVVDSLETIFAHRYQWFHILWHTKI